jgi:hypothetical protein
LVTAAADGSGPPVGARVVAHLPHSGWAERAVARAEQVAVLPDSVSIEPRPSCTTLRTRAGGSISYWNPWAGRACRSRCPRSGRAAR